MGVADNGIYWHVIASTLFQGGAIVMGLAIIARLFSPQEWQIRGVDMRLANGTMAALLAVWSLVFAVLAMVTGIWMTWGYEAVSSTSLTINKEMFGTFALLALMLMLWIRYRYGPALWNDTALKLTYAALGLLTTLAATVNGSLGGEAGLLGTALADIWDFLGVDPANPMVLSTAGGVTFLAVVLFAVLCVAGVATLRRLRRRALY
ncbi:MAG: hypothetical protein V3S68_06075 [Dehalococcoidia bacterium]